MSKYSRIYKVGKKRFRYNYEDAMLEYVSNVTKEIEADNAEWTEKFGYPLWEVVDGKVLHERIGLGREDWKEGPEYWCDVYAAEIDEECAILLKEYEMYG